MLAEQTVSLAKAFQPPGCLTFGTPPASSSSPEPNAIHCHMNAGEITLGLPCAFAGCSGFLHLSSGSIGVVLCSAWGFEELAMRKAWRLLAEAIAKAGFPCIRFDYPGTGNSLQQMEAVSSLDVWIQASHAAADELRARSGAQRLVFLGLSLGGMIAAHTAWGRSDAIGIQLISPVVQGRSYMRALSTTARLVADQTRSTRVVERCCGAELLGFTMSRSLVTHINGIDLTGLPHLRRSLGATVFDDIRKSSARNLLAHFASIGITTTHEDAAPFQIVSSDATRIQPLPVSSDQVVAALNAYPAGPVSKPRDLGRPSSRLHAELVEEEAVRFGGGRRLFGVFCKPMNAPTTKAVVLLNRGLNPHIGWRRSSVDHARALAVAGIASFRIDVAGVGESEDRDEASDLIYHADITSDVMSAVDWLAERGFERLALAGVCSGAYVALATAHKDTRITDIFAFNPQRFVWDPSEQAEDVVRYGMRTTKDYTKEILSGRILYKALRNPKRIIPAARFLAKHIFARLVAAVPIKMQTIIWHHKFNQVKSLFDHLAARNVSVSLIYSDHDPGISELQRFFGQKGIKLTKRKVAVSFLGGADHNFTARETSDVVLSHILSGMTECGI